MSDRRIYGQTGVYIPYVEYSNDANNGNRDMARDGFLLVRIFGRGVFVLQSIASRELYFVKIVHRIEAQGETAHHDQFPQPTPPEFRISTVAAARFQLPDQPNFPHLEFYQTPNNRDWALYFRYCNGGTLEAFRDKYYQARRRVPEHFIWHVTAELCWAFAYLYYGIRQGEPIPNPLTRPANFNIAYHRDVTMSNVLLHYRPRGRGSLALSGNRLNAFPDIVLSDFGDSALQSDPADQLKLGLYEDEGTANEWEDVYQLGSILRSLCMTHVLFPRDDPSDHNNVVPGQFKNEQQAWLDRPDSRTLAAVNTHPIGPAYSDVLIDTLSRFEWPDQRELLIEEGASRVHVPGMDWVVGTLLPLAHETTRRLRIGNKVPGFYNPLDVSWTRSFAPMPYAPELDDPRLVNTLTTDIQMNFQFCGSEFVDPRVTRVLPTPP